MVVTCGNIPLIKRIKCFKITKLILIALPAIVFGLFTIIFTLQQNKFESLNREQDQNQLNEQNIRKTFENYIHDISNILFKKSFNRTNDDHLLIIRIKTLTALRHIDIRRKRDIILFLYESRLLRSNLNKNQRLDLNGADLSYMEFIGSPNAPILLNYLYLSNIIATNIVFQWCQLNNAIFDYSSMTNMKLINVAIANTSFRQIYAPNTTFHNVIFYRNLFFGSIMPRFHYISTVDSKGPVDMTNVDLIHSLLTFDDIEMDLSTHLIDPLITITNARLPNGLFTFINSSNLVIDGGAEQGCKSNGSSQVWIKNSDLPLLEFSEMKINSTTNSHLNESKCYFLAQSDGESSLDQYIDLQSFSVLIDNKQAIYRLSSYLGCIGRQNGNISIILTFLAYNGIPNEQYKEVLPTNDVPHIDFDIDRIPPLTRILHLSLHSYSLDKNGYCIIDDVQFQIFKKENNIRMNYKIKF